MTGTAPPSASDRIGLFGAITTGGPLERAELTFGPSSISVLYGLNGAGKSSVLSSITKGLSGSAGPSDCLLFVRPRAGSWGASLLQAVDDWGAMDERLLRSWGLWPSDGPPDLRDAALAAAIVRQGLFALRPVGLTSPAWEVFACAYVDDDPLLSEELTRSTAALAEYRHLLAADELAAEELADVLAELELLPLLVAFRQGLPPSQRQEWPSRQRPATAVTGPGSDSKLPVLAGLLGLVDATLQLAHGVEPPEDSVRGGGQADVLRTASVQALLKAEGVRPLLVSEGQIQLNQRHAGWIAAVVREANLVYSSLLLDAPRLDLVWRSLNEWSLEAPLEWEVSGRSISSLSKAQLRWAAFSIRLALDNASDRRPVLLLDEPEAALHRSAEEYVARGLSSLVPARASLVLVASHSPELLDHENAEVVQVVRRNEQSQLVPLVAADRQTLQELGLRASDLLRRTRVFLLVEGHHDELVVQGLIGERLASAAVEVLPLRGGSGLKHVVESRVLFDFTDAHVVVMLDNVQADLLSRTWETAMREAAALGVPSGVQVLVDNLPGKIAGKTSAENLFLRELLGASLKLGNFARVAAFGLVEPDIQYYLPVSSFMKGCADTWHELFNTFQCVQLDGGDFKNFKDWLQRERGASFADETFLRAIADLKYPPPEFLALAEFCAKRSSAVRDSRLAL